MQRRIVFFRYAEDTLYAGSKTASRSTLALNKKNVVGKESGVPLCLPTLLKMLLTNFIYLMAINPYPHHPCHYFVNIAMVQVNVTFGKNIQGKTQRQYQIQCVY